MSEETAQLGAFSDSKSDFAQVCSDVTLGADSSWSWLLDSNFVEFVAVGASYYQAKSRLIHLPR